MRQAGLVAALAALMAMGAPAVLTAQQAAAEAPTAADVQAVPVADDGAGRWMGWMGWQRGDHGNRAHGHWRDGGWAGGDWGNRAWDHGGRKGRMDRAHRSRGWGKRHHPRSGPRGMRAEGPATMRFVTDWLWQQADADSDGKLSAEEVAALLEAQFAGADSDGDGRLSQAEIEAAVAARLAELRAHAEEAAEAEGEGAAGAASLLRWLERMPVGIPAPMLARMIDRADDDGDGLLSPQELRIPRLGSDFVKRFDRDGDGLVARDELRPASRDGRKPRWRGHCGYPGDGAGPETAPEAAPQGDAPQSAPQEGTAVPAP